MPQVRREGQRYRCRSPLSGLVNGGVRPLARQRLPLVSRDDASQDAATVV